MLLLFRYNWQVRDEWFHWSETVPYEELVQLRTGGVGSFLRTLWHVVDAEYSWIRAIDGKPDLQFPFEDYSTVDKIRSFSDNCRGEMEGFLATWDAMREHRLSRRRGDPAR
jgi:uncharacterized damage-inducible protein DinB